MGVITLSFCESCKYIPDNYDRVTIKPSGDNVVYKTWPSKGAMLTALSMEARGAYRQNHWRAWADTNGAKRIIGKSIATILLTLTS